MNEDQREHTLPLNWPEGDKRVLLHSCCAPCSASIIEAITHAGLELTVLFYNPNIYPHEEYVQRKDENKRFADKLGVVFIDADHDRARWFRQTEGLESEPERGMRCTVCFDMRIGYAADYAFRHDFPVFATTLGISRWKNMALINACGHGAAAAYSGLFYWDCNWRKNGGVERMHALSQLENFYRQEYCGCLYSLRDINRRRQAAGRSAIGPSG